MACAASTEPAGQFDLRVYNNGAGSYTVGSPNVKRSCIVIADR